MKLYVAHRARALVRDQNAFRLQVRDRRVVDVRAGDEHAFRPRARRGGHVHRARIVADIERAAAQADERSQQIGASHEIDAPVRRQRGQYGIGSRPVFFGHNEVQLLRGGDELFPRLIEAIGMALHEVWLATYIFHDDAAAEAVALALAAAVSLSCAAPAALAAPQTGVFYFPGCGSERLFSQGGLATQAGCFGYGGMKKGIRAVVGIGRRQLAL